MQNKELYQFIFFHNPQVPLLELTVPWGHAASSCTGLCWSHPFGLRHVGHHPKVRLLVAWAPIPREKGEWRNGCSSKMRVYTRLFPLCINVLHVVFDVTLLTSFTISPHLAPLLPSPPYPSPPSPSPPYPSPPSTPLLPTPLCPTPLLLLPLLPSPFILSSLSSLFLLPFPPPSPIPPSLLLSTPLFPSPLCPPSSSTPFPSPSTRHCDAKKLLQRASPNYLRWSPWFYWLLPFLLPGLSLLAAMLSFCHLYTPVGFVLALVIMYFGFFGPMASHRINHDSNWPNPALYGAYLSGVAHTLVCFFAAVYPHILFLVPTLECLVLEYDEC